MISLKIDRINIPPGISVPPTVSLYYKELYDDTFTFVDSGIVIDANGNVQGSPKPTIDVEAATPYVLLAVNESCGYQYQQSLIVYPYCPVGYDITPDMSECYYEEVTEATAPTAGENTVEKNNTAYSTCGAYIYHEGYNINGTGTADHVDITNPFWLNGATPACGNATTTEGPLNRCGLWSVTEASDQDVGFPVCLDIAEGKIYYIGMGTDNLGIINLDGVNIITQDPTALGAQYSIGAAATFKVWHIYPVFIPSGPHILEILGHNDSGAAAMGCEIYDNTPAEIIAATSYGDLNLIFSSKDYIGMPVMLGSGGVGYSCPPDYALKACASPYECVRRVTTNVLINSA
jgi:hypothetical protein